VLAREWLVRRAGARGAIRPSWRQSLPGCPAGSLVLAAAAVRAPARGRAWMAPLIGGFGQRGGSLRVLPAAVFGSQQPRPWLCLRRIWVTAAGWIAWPGRRPPGGGGRRVVFSPQDAPARGGAGAGGEVVPAGEPGRGDGIAGGGGGDDRPGAGHLGEAGAGCAGRGGRLRGGGRRGARRRPAARRRSRSAPGQQPPVGGSGPAARRPGLR